MHTMMHESSPILLLFVVIALSWLPIPSRGQTTISTTTAASQPSSSTQEGGVQFSTAFPNCVTCKTAFASPACQTVLASIAERAQSSSNMVAAMSNETIVACQCNPTFLSAYNSCLHCLAQTDQLDLVFGTTNGQGQIPSQQGLETYCMLASSSPTRTNVTSSSTTAKANKPASAASSSGLLLPTTPVQVALCVMAKSAFVLIVAFVFVY